MKPRILAVDDNPMNLRLVCVILKKAGYDVVNAKSGQEALDAVRARMPDLIVADVAMPDVDGLELTRRLKAAAETKHIPILLVSAYAMKSEIETAMASGCDGYVTKPIKVREFAQMVASQLSKSPV